MIFFLLGFAGAAFAYQQSYLVFSLDPSWIILEQRTGGQTFQKNGMIIQITQIPLSESIDIAQYAKGINATIVQQGKQGIVQETILNSKGQVVILSIAKDKEQYGLTLIGPSSRTAVAKQEMTMLYSTLSFSTTPQFTKATWEEELKDPPHIGIFEKYRIPWGWIILLLMIAGLVYFYIQRRKKKKSQVTHTHHSGTVHSGETHHHSEKKKE